MTPVPDSEAVRRVAAWSAGLRRYGDAAEVLEPAELGRWLPEGASLADPIADRVEAASWIEAVAGYVFRERVSQTVLSRSNTDHCGGRRRSGCSAVPTAAHRWRGQRLRAALAAVALLAVSGCTFVARKGYQAATDERSLQTQRTDAGIALAVKRSLRSAQAAGAGDLDVFCRNGVVVLAGSTMPDSALAMEATRLASATDGVRGVETYFVPVTRSRASDFAIKQKIHARLVGDGALKAGQVDLAVMGGHVVLVGVVDAPDKIERILSHARATDGVQATRSFIQVAGP